MPRQLTQSDVLHIAQQAIRIFASIGLRCCLIGSTACSLYGVNRTPNDVDLVVLTTEYDPESLKEVLVNEDMSFYLVRSRNPSANYKVLWCELPHAKCKVDILLPGILNIPVVPQRDIVWISGYPVMPLIPLLLLKLQGLVDHRRSTRRDEQEKQHVDASDVWTLLQLAVERRQNVWQSKMQWVPRSLVYAADGHVADYIDEYPRTAAPWRSIGL
ncbi:hypothetical protein BN946_scf184751.g7 [Trametes cinnabarina]|uniref:Uncharacterized protein n=1 Tax=Pycnoporus cinnabarinus TaxID=5643 RepID=A0A060SPP6_PYCCI|nr:hypothetical protein BN946_scf184751.g7 [Trametes cinnabarina]